MSDENRRRIDVLGAALELGPAMGGAKATIENAQMEAARWGKPAYIRSPDPEKLLTKARKMRVDARIEKTTRGTVLVRIEAP